MGWGLLRHETAAKCSHSPYDWQVELRDSNEKAVEAEGDGEIEGKKGDNIKPTKPVV